MKEPILFLFILLFCISCDHDSTTVDRTLRLEDFTKDTTSYKVTKIIPLETLTDALLGDYLTVRISGEYIYVYDRNARNAIHRFDSPTYF